MSDLAETKWGIGLVERQLLNDLRTLWDGPLQPGRLNNIERGLRAWFASLVLTVSTRGDVWDVPTNATHLPNYTDEAFDDHLLDYEFTPPGTRLPLIAVDGGEKEFLENLVNSRLAESALKALPDWIAKEGQAFAFIDAWYEGFPREECESAARDMRRWEEHHGRFTPECLGYHAISHWATHHHATYLVNAHRSGITVYGCSPVYQVCEEHIFSEWPAYLFSAWSDEYSRAVRQLRGPGIGIDLPPLLGIVLSRAAHRDDIPIALRDLRDEYAKPRRKLWEVLEAMWSAPTLKEQMELGRTLKAAAQGVFDAAFPERIDVLDLALGVAQLTPSGIVQAARGLRARDAPNARVSAVSFAKRLALDVRTIESARNVLSRHLTDSEKRQFGME